MSTSDKRMITIKESDALRAMPGLNPQALIAAAIDKGAGIETLERLVGLAREVQAISAREAFYAAKAEFKRRCPRIKKSTTANIATRSGGSFSYSYSPLDEVTEVVDPILSELGLSYSWKAGPFVTGHVSQVCILAHKLGHEEDSGSIPLPLGAEDGRMSGAQRVGSVTTYARRYSLCGILGITPEADDDAQDPPPGFKPRPAEPKRESTPLPNADFFTESETLLPTPEDDVERERVWNEIVRLRKVIDATKTTDKARKQWNDDKDASWATTCGKATPSTADLAALNDHLAWLKTREPK